MAPDVHGVLGWLVQPVEGKIITRDPADLAMEVAELLKRASINLYMFQGGTNFGFYNGCSARGYTDLPQITSYNYDALMTEWGEPTAKFYQVRQVVRKMFPHLKTMEPRDRKRIAYGQAVPTGQVSLFSCVDSLAECQKSAVPLSMEEAGSGYGYMFYRTHVRGYNKKMKVKAVQASDRVQYYLNRVFEGTHYQNNSGEELELYFKEDNELALLVENMGRVNYGYKLQAPTQKRESERESWSISILKADGNSMPWILRISKNWIFPGTGSGIRLPFTGMNSRLRNVPTHF